MREMYGVMVAKRATGVIIITSGFFTQEAQSFAIGKPVELIEGNQLAPLVAGVQVVKDKPFKTDVKQVSTIYAPAVAINWYYEQLTEVKVQVTGFMGALVILIVNL